MRLCSFILGTCKWSVDPLCPVTLITKPQSIYSFYRATLYVSAVFAVARCPSVRLSVCLSVRHVGGLYPDG